MSSDSNTQPVFFRSATRAIIRTNFNPRFSGDFLLVIKEKYDSYIFRIDALGR